MRETPISDPVKMRLLTNPVRYAIWITTIKLAPLTVQQIGAQICRDPGSLYRHINKLEKAGLIKPHSDIRTKGRKAIAYTTDPNPYLVYDPDNHETVEAIIRVCENAARQAAQESRQAFESGRCRVRSSTRDTFLKADGFWANEEELRLINKKIDELRELLLKRTTPEGRRPIRLTFIMRPAPL